MARFKFSLQKVLGFRIFERKEAEQNFGKALQKRKLQLHKIEQLMAKMEEIAENNASSGTTTLESIRRNATAIVFIRVQITEETIILEKLQAEEKQAQLMLAQRKRVEESLQTLHDNEKESWSHEQRKEEIDFLDEQAAMRFYRNNTTDTVNRNNQE